MNEIVFRRPAFDQMDEIVRSNPARVGEFAAALQQMAAALTAGAATFGESREPPYRVAFFGELTVRFRPAPADGRVYVVRVRLRRPR